MPLTPALQSVLRVPGLTRTGYSATLDASATGNESRSWRTIVPALTMHGSQVRVKFLTHPVNTTGMRSAGIGIWNGVEAQTNERPLQLSFYLSTGILSTSYVLGVSVVVTSEWVKLRVGPGMRLVVIYDVDTTNGNFPYLNVGGVGSYFHNSAQTYNQAAPASANSSALGPIGWNTLEVR